MSRFNRFASAAFGLCLCFGAVSTHANNLDVIFVLDGSGSIDDGEWLLQRQGLASALSNQNLVPRDGSIAVGVVQFSDPDARIEIPYTLINGDAAANALAAQVNAMVQLGGGTNPGDGVALATSLLSTAQRDDADQIYCLSTDGTPNAGQDTGAAVSAAQTTASLDQLNVIAITGGSFTETAAQGAYGGFLVGDGVLEVARSTAEYSGIVGASCFSQETVELVGIEVNQAVQNWENTIELIAEKRTFVRAHIQPVLDPANPGQQVEVQGRLRGFRSGSELAGSPLTATNPGGSLTVMDNAASRRGDIDESLNFLLPNAWVDGNVTLTLERLGGGLDCLDAAQPTANDCSVTIDFEEGSVPEVKFYRVQWTDPRTNTTTQPTTADVTELVRRSRAQLPIATMDVSSSTLNYTGDVTVRSGGGGLTSQFLVNINSSLNLRRLLDLCFTSLGCDTRYYGVLRGSGAGGIADSIPGSSSSGIMPANNFAYGRNRHNHEIGHTLGIRHATLCGARDSRAPTFPNTAVIGGVTQATLGPMNQGDDKLVYGFDTNAMKVIDPNLTFEMMSYCRGRDSAGTFRWISDFTWNSFRSAFATTFSAENPSVLRPLAVVRPAVAVPDTFLIVRGSLDLSAPLTGEYTLEMLDAADVRVGAPVPFDLELLETDPADSENGGVVDEEEVTVGLFDITVPFDTDMRTAVLFRGGLEIGRMSSSPNAPTVTLTSPVGGETFDEDTIIELTLLTRTTRVLELWLAMVLTWRPMIQINRSQ